MTSRNEIMPNERGKRRLSYTCGSGSETGCPKQRHNMVLNFVPVARCALIQELSDSFYLSPDKAGAEPFLASIAPSAIEG